MIWFFGTHNIYELPELIKELETPAEDGSRKRICAIRDKAVPEKDFNIIRSHGVNAWLPIMEGCNNFAHIALFHTQEGASAAVL